MFINIVDEKIERCDCKNIGNDYNKYFKSIRPDPNLDESLVSRSLHKYM